MGLDSRLKHHAVCKGVNRVIRPRPASLEYPRRPAVRAGFHTGRLAPVTVQAAPTAEPPPDGATCRPGRAGQPVPPGLCRPGSEALPPLTGSVHLTIPLLTLLGLADRPGLAAGFGPLHADICRSLADAMGRHRTTRWGVIITDPDGRAIGLGGPALARRRPVKPPGNGGGSLLATGPPAARASPAAHGPGGWAITLTTEPLAPCSPAAAW
jgi:hypothetical protein